MKAPRLLALCAALIPLAATAAAAQSGAPGPCASLTVTYGTPFKYNVGPPGYPSQYVGSDIWFNTWDSQNNNITASNDSLKGWANNNPGGSNFAISKLSTTTTATVGSNVNVMAPWGTVAQGGSDTFSFKAGGIISVNGTLYVAVNRATNTTPTAPYQFLLQNMQIIKSTPPYTTWTPTPPGPTTPYSPPMFTGYIMGNADFLQYGKDYVGQTADNSSVYVYAYATEGPYNNANNVYLARVKISDISDNTAATGTAKWSFWQGGDGMADASWSTTWPPSPVMSGTKTFGASVGTQYFPTLGCYVRLNWWYPSVTAGTGLDTTSTIWQPWAAPHPWGPWTVIGGRQAYNSTGQMGLFSPHIMPASLVPSTNSVAAMALSAGDYNSQLDATGDYTLTMVPVTVSK